MMPKQDPGWRIALGAFPESRGLLVRIATDTRHTGFGYSGADGPYKGTGADVLKEAFHRFGRCLAGKDPLRMEKLLVDVDEVDLSDLCRDQADLDRGRMRAKSAIDIALHDLAGKALGVPVYQLLGGLVREEAPVIRIMALKEPEEMARIALELTGEGYRYIKIKLEGILDQDVARVKAIRQAVGDKTHLTVDANQSYDARGAIEMVGALEQYHIELVEQPVPAGDIQGLLAVSRTIRSPIEAHECVDTPARVFSLAKTGFFGFMNLSVTLGGLRSLKTVVDVCRLAGIKCVISCVGTRILSAASMHFIASCGHLDFACQIGEFARFNNDPATGLEIDNGMLRVSHRPGLGIQVNI